MSVGSLALLGGVIRYWLKAYAPDDTGVYTDTNEYAAIIPECTNLSVGYQRQHGPRETLDVVHCEQLLAAMLEIDTSQLVIERDPAEQDDGGWWFDRGRGHGDPFVEAVADHPALAAWMLEQCGVTYDDFRTALWAEEMDDDRGYRPLMPT